MKKKGKLLFNKALRIIRIVVAVSDFIKVLYWIYVRSPEILSWIKVQIWISMY